MDERSRQWRARALMMAAAIGFGVLAVTLVTMQVVRHQDYAELARENRQYSRRVLAPRGLVSDRTGFTLAHNEYQARITYPRERVRADDPVLNRLIELLDLDRDALFEWVDRAPPGDRVTLVRRAKPPQIAIVEEHRVELPQVQLRVEPRRQYPGESLASHLVGYVGEVRRDETGRNSPYFAGDMIGRTGIEAFAERLLRGEHGRKVVEVNAAGHVIGELPGVHVPVVPGGHVYLTIHHALQKRLEELLDGYVGAGVVIEVATGDVLAAASAPAVDPNEFTGGISHERAEQLRSDPNKPEFNRAFRGVYPPGSPFKLITAAAALERGLVDPEETFEPCYGGYRFGNRFFGCWKETGHGVLDLEGAIVQSCDTYFYQLVQRLTVDQLAEAARRFGLGYETGLESFHEQTGLVPDADFFDARHGPRGWTDGVKLNLAIGQGELLVTPLQMARTFAAIGGDGYLYRPHVLLVTENAYGVRDARHVYRSTEPVCSPRVRRFLQESMRSVVHDDLGTGGLAQVDGFEVAGKTGTSENPFGDHHAWFVAYAPARDPEVAVAVIVENSGHGGEVAAPIVGKVLHEYFELQGAVASDGEAR